MHKFMLIVSKIHVDSFFVFLRQMLEISPNTLQYGPKLFVQLVKLALSIAIFTNFGIQLSQ